VIPRPGRDSIRQAGLRLAGPLVVAAGRQARTGADLPDSVTARAPRVLLVRPDHLGDMLLAAPAAWVLADALPNSTIDWLVGPWAADIARRCGGPGDVLTVSFPGFTRQTKASALEPYRLLAREAARLRARRYDAALILRPDHWWGAMLAAAAGIPRRFGYAVAECLPFLTDLLPLPSGRQQHAVPTNQGLARLAAIRLSGAAVPKDIRRPRYPVDDADLAWARDWLAAQCGYVPSGSFNGAQRTTSGGPLVVLHPGSGAVLKNWSSERWAKVVSELRAQTGARVVVTGGPAERDLVAAVIAGLDPPPPVLAGSTTLGQLAALFASAALVLGGDSGPLHLAAAVGTPSVRVYGPTDIAEFGPWPPGPQQVALSANLSCQPCRALVDPPCGAVEQPACLTAITVGAVVAAARRVLAANVPSDASRMDAPPPSIILPSPPRL
jgi:lipopolysaccharide heptosyltransferase II